MGRRGSDAVGSRHMATEGGQGGGDRDRLNQEHVAGQGGAKAEVGQEGVGG